jgi:polyhydroxyalkanoate synthesis regulator phasin
MKVNPRDVVSIPSDYNNEKGRCCEYAVVDEITTGEALPHQEVFCVGAGCDTDTVDAGIDNLESRIDALEDRAYELRSEYKETENRHNEIYDLGGDPSDFEIAEQGALEARIDELNAELSDLNYELSRLDN